MNRRRTGNGLGICVRTTGRHKRTLSRILLCKPPNLNGAALTKVVTGRLNIGFHVASNPTVRGSNSLTTVLAGLSSRSMLFVSRVRHLSHDMRRILCSTVRSCTVSVVVNGNPDTQAIHVSLPGFALMNTAAQTNTLTTPLQSQFNVVGQLRCCGRPRLRFVISHTTRVLGVNVIPAKTDRVTHHSQKAPHVTGHLLGQMHSFTRIVNSKIVARRVTSRTLRHLCMSGVKLSQVSQHILRYVVRGCSNNPMKVSAVTTTVDRRESAVRSICRPCLVRLKFLKHAPHKEMTAGLTCRRLNVSRAKGWR